MTINNKSDITMSFKSVNSEGIVQVNDALKNKSAEIGHVDEFGSITDVLETFNMEGNYRVLALCIRFMDGLYPQDITMFFDDFSAIEEEIFKEIGVDYTPVHEAYIKYRNIINKDYIDFIMCYYPEGARGLYEVAEKYNSEQMEFIINRNLSMMDLLPDIGTKLAPSYYANIVVDDTK